MLMIIENNVHMAMFDDVNPRTKAKKALSLLQVVSAHNVHPGYNCVASEI